MNPKYRKKSLNGYELDRRLLSLGEAELEKVIRQSFNVEETPRLYTRQERIAHFHLALHPSEMLHRIGVKRENQPMYFCLRFIC